MKTSLAYKTAAAAIAAPDRRAMLRPVHPQIVVGLSVKADAVDEEKRTFEGLLSVWGPDLGDDVMHKGAFKKTIAEWKKSGDALPLLNSHNHWDAMSVGGQLLDAKETDEGLWTKWEVIPGPDGDRILDRIRPGSNGRSPLGKMSIGYEPMKFDFEQNDAARFGRLRNLREVSLKEGSLVIFPMAPGARLDSTTVKSFLDDANNVDPTELSDDTKADLRRLASRIGKLLDPSKSAPPNPAPPAKPTAPAPSAKGGDNPEEDVSDDPPPAPPAPTPAPETPPAESEEKNESVYLFGEALQQRLQKIRVHSALHSTSRIL